MIGHKKHRGGFPHAATWLVLSGLMLLPAPGSAQDSRTIEDIIVEPLDGLEELDVPQDDGVIIRDIFGDTLPVEDIPVEQLPAEELTFPPADASLDDADISGDILQGLETGSTGEAGANTDAETGAVVSVEPALRFGLVSAGVRSAVEQDYAPFIDYLAVRTGRDVKLVLLSSWSALMNGLESGRIDAARMPSFAYLTSRLRCACVEPVVSPLSADRASGFRSVLFVSSSSAIETLSDVAGRIISVPDKASVAGYFMPTRQLDRSSIRADIRAKGSFDAAMQDLLDGKADVASGWYMDDGDGAFSGQTGSLTEFLRQRGLSPNQFRVIWQSDMVPFPPLVVRSAVNGNDKISLRQAFVDLKDSAPDLYDVVEKQRTGGFRLVRDERFDLLSGFLENKTLAEPSEPGSLGSLRTDPPN